MLRTPYATADVARSPLTLKASGWTLVEHRQARKGVMTMDRKKLTSEEKLDRLLGQIETFRQGQAVLERFERVTRKWFQQARAAKKAASKPRLSS
jgi:hypothetical protein